MKTENLMKASDSFEMFLKYLRLTHGDAVESEDQFAEIVIYDLLSDVAKAGWRLARIKEAAK